MSANQMRKECHRNIHKFALNILDNNSDTSIQPSFGREQAEEFFCRVYLASPKTFIHPVWMPEYPQPVVPMITAPFTGVISGLNSSSAPSPVDQIPYTVIARCPSLLPALMHLYSCCWLTRETPTAWKVGIVHLLGKKKAADDPSNPSCPDIMHEQGVHLLGAEEIASLHGQQWLLNTATQKAFVDGVLGCSEHHLKLLSILREAQRR